MVDPFYLRHEQVQRPETDQVVTPNGSESCRPVAGDVCFRVAAELVSTADMEALLRLDDRRPKPSSTCYRSPENVKPSYAET